jgi:trans-aconitate methyltransferase
MWNPTLYDDKHSFVWKHGAALIELLLPLPGERVLDLGCGTGHLTAEIANRGAEVVGIDSSPPMIDQARQSYPAATFDVMDARDFAFAAPFDAVFSNAVLHWIKQPAQVIDCVRRCLKPGGRFVAEFGGRGNVRQIATAIANVFRTRGYGPFELPWYYPTIGEYANLLERGGLELTYAILFERPTPLDGECGLRHWIEMFGSEFLNRVPAAERELFFQNVEEQLRPVLYREGVWSADYRRLRVVAQT